MKLKTKLKTILLLSILLSTQAHSLPPPLTIILNDSSVTLMGQNLKTCIERIHCGLCRHIQPGDIVEFRSNYRAALTHILAKRIYASIEDMVEKEGVSNLLPHISDTQQGIAFYNAKPGYRNGVAEHGITVFQVQILPNKV
jgi:ASC-1-like (ASCH) protein